MTESADPSNSFSQKLENLQAISQMVNQSSDWKVTLDQLVPLARAVLIFDNLVLFEPEAKEGTVEVCYARAIGRGRSAEADLAWGEAAANQVIKTGQVFIQQPDPNDPDSSRIDLPHLLALPLRQEDKSLGILVIIRFGGPYFEGEDIRLASFVSEEITHLLERKAWKDRLQVLEDKQKQARLQEDFISTISHELLTPLGFIKGYATTLLRQDTIWDTNSQHEFLNIIDQETDRLQELIDNLLDSARLQSGTLRIELQPVRLDALLRDVILRARTHHKSLQVQLDITQPITPVPGDPRRLAQVFDNLVSNAIKYAPGSAITISLIRENNHMKITFQDTGPGIPSQYLPYMFDRFFRNPEQAVNVRGTGLGLYICKQIVEAHQGVISIESFVGEGTAVHIELPCQQSAEANQAPKSGRPGKQK